MTKSQLITRIMSRVDPLKPDAERAFTLDDAALSTLERIIHDEGFSVPSGHAGDVLLGPSRTGRRRKPKWSETLLAAAIIVALTGIGAALYRSDNHAGVATIGVASPSRSIPVVSHPPSRGQTSVTHATGTTTQGAASPCTQGVLILGPGPYISGVSGERALTFTLNNSGPSSCKVSGYPAATLYDAQGTSLSFTYAQGGGRFVTARPPKPVVLMSGSTAYFIVATNRCDLGVSGKATTIRVAVPGDTAKHVIAASYGPGTPNPGAFPLELCTSGGEAVTVSPIAASLDELYP